MKVKEGGYYLNRNGRVVGPLEQAYKAKATRGFLFECYAGGNIGTTYFYKENGEAENASDKLGTAQDLIEEIYTMDKAPVEVGDKLEMMGWTYDLNSKTFIGEIYTVQYGNPNNTRFQDELFAVRENGHQRISTGSEMLVRVIKTPKIGDKEVGYLHEIGAEAGDRVETVNGASHPIISVEGGEYYTEVGDKPYPLNKTLDTWRISFKGPGAMTPVREVRKVEFTPGLHANKLRLKANGNISVAGDGIMGKEQVEWFIKYGPELLKAYGSV